MNNFLTYFAVGFLLDALGTVDILAVQKDQAVRSAVVSFTGTMLDCYIFYDIIISPDFTVGLLGYALGGAVGTIFTMRSKSLKNFFTKILELKRKMLPGQYIVAEIKNRIPEKMDA